jgi:hypothetical protein
MTGANLDIGFRRRDEISVRLESTAAADVLRQVEILLFCLYASRQAANLGSGVGGDALSLGAVLLNAGEAPRSFLEDGARAMRVVPAPPAPGGKRYRASLRWGELEDPASIRFKLSLVGFGAIGRGSGYYAPVSVLALLFFLLNERSTDDAYVAGLAAAARHLGSMFPYVGVPNQVALAFDAAAAGRGELVRAGPAQALEQERLADIRRAFAELWATGECSRPAVAEALALAARTLGESPENGTNDHRPAVLLQAALGGYLWRVAEAGDVDPLRNDLARTFLVAARPGAADALNLFATARQCIVDGVQLGHGSPGGATTGPAFLEAGYRWVAHDVLGTEASVVDARLLRVAFRCGVAIRDVAELLEREPSLLEELERKPHHRSFRLTRDGAPRPAAPARPEPHHKSFRLTR